MQDKFGLPYIEGYGLTETAAPTHVNPVHRPKKQCAGIPFFDTDSRVIDPDKLVELGPNQVGEIISRGPQIFRGYWNQPQATKDTFIEFDGHTFFRTGDLGYYDEEGYFFITDRLKRMINAAGFKVWPAEVEAMLYAHPDVQEACVISTRDAYRGESVKAVVVLKAASRGKATARGHHRLGERTHGRVQIPARRRVCRCAAEDRHRQGVLEKAAGGGECASARGGGVKSAHEKTIFCRAGLRCVGDIFRRTARPIQRRPRDRKAVGPRHPPGAAVGGGYLVIRNKGVAADRLVGVSSPASARVEIHEMAMEKDVMRMREVKGVDVPAKKSVELKPGGYHLMLIELKAPLKPGDKVPLTLRFEKAGEVKTELAVGAMTASGPAMKH